MEQETGGNMMQERQYKILKLLYSLSREQGKLVIVVTHNAALKDMADKVIRIRSGRIECVETNAHPVPVEGIEW